jgi:hypothetical protein
MSSSSSIKRWGRKWNIKKGNPEQKNLTHLLLDGGTMSIPPEDYPIFLDGVAKDIDRNNKNFIIELRTPVYKFLTDLDILENENEVLDEATIQMWIQDLLEILRGIYPNFKHSPTRQEYQFFIWTI